MNLYIITGTTRGIGAALLSRLNKPGNLIIANARRLSPNLEDIARNSIGQLKIWLQDLGEVEKLADEFEMQLNELNEKSCSSITLVNNAGILEPIGPVGQHKAAELALSLKINLLAPQILTDIFIHKTQGWQIEKKVLNISSGAGRKARAGWASYCSTKAGLDMYSDCIAKEQISQEFPVKIVSLAPGVIDTGMQELIRTQSKDKFPDVERFWKLKVNQQLWTPEYTAELIDSYLHSTDFGNNTIDDLRSWNQG